MRVVLIFPSNRIMYAQTIPWVTYCWIYITYIPILHTVLINKLVPRNSSDTRVKSTCLVPVSLAEDALLNGLSVPLYQLTFGLSSSSAKQNSDWGLTSVWICVFNVVDPVPTVKCASLWIMLKHSAKSAFLIIRRQEIQKLRENRQAIHI